MFICPLDTKLFYFMATFTKQDAYNSQPERVKNNVSLEDWLKAEGHQFTGYFDDDYLSEIEQYKDKPWYDNLLTNPYLAGNNVQFSPNFWQQFKEDLFGDTSARDAYNAQLSASRSQWLSEFLEKMRQQDYNEPINQVARQNAAGINSDLAGNITPGSAAENDQPITGGVPMNHDTSDLQTMFNIGTSLLGGVFSVIGNLQNIHSASIDNKLKSVQLGQNYNDWSKNLISDSLTEYWNGLDSPSVVDKVFEDGTWIDGITSKFSQKLRNMPISHKDRKRLRGIIDDLIYTKDSGSKSYTAWFENMVNDKVSALRESRNNRAQKSALPGASVADSRALDFLSNEIYKPIQDIQLDVMKLQLKYNQSYLSTPGLGRAKGEAEKAGYEIQKGMRDVKTRLMRAFEEINKKITGSKDLSPMWKIALQAGVASAESFSMSKLGFGK